MASGRSAGRLADGLSLFRMLFSVGLLFTDPLSVPFFAVYVSCGLSDVLDGTVARRTHAESRSGARLDTVADIVFYGMALVALLPMLTDDLPPAIWVVAVAIAAVRALAYAACAVRTGSVEPKHSVLNKASGLLVFVVPFAMGTQALVPICSLACVLSALSTTDELVSHLRGGDVGRDCGNGS